MVEMKDYAKKLDLHYSKVAKLLEELSEGAYGNNELSQSREKEEKRKANAAWLKMKNEKRTK